MLRNTLESYGSVSKIFHWVIGLSIISLLCVGLIMTTIAPSSLKNTLYGLHKSTGVIIFFLALARLLWRLSMAVPALPLTLGTAHHFFARVSTYSLYMLMFVMPLSGFIMSQAANKPVTLYNLYTLPALLPLNPDISHTARLTHHYAGYILMGILTVHIGAAFYHHAILRNNILKRMLPS